MKNLKKGDQVQIKLKNQNEFQVIFVGYSNFEGIAYGKFQDSNGEFDTKAFHLEFIVSSPIA